MSAVETIKENKTEIKTKMPKMYRVLLHNDDVNDFLLVMQAVKTVFKYDMEEVHKIVMTAHEEGVATCKIEPLETAELHRDQLQSFGLCSTIEPE